MKNTITSQSSDFSEAEIQRAGYLLWHEYGRPKGCEDKFLSIAQTVLRPPHGRAVKTRP